MQDKESNGSSNKLVETVSETIHAATNLPNDELFCEVDVAEAVFRAIKEAGLVIVPREPTDAMLDAAEYALANWRQTLDRDEAMARSYRPTHQRAFIASATPPEKHAIRYRAMITAGEE